MPMLEALDLSFRYRGGGPVLEKLSLELFPGRSLALAGANGSGKSTLLAILAGLLPPTGGEIRFRGLAGRAALAALKRETALLPQNVDHWLLGETGREDFFLGLDTRDRLVRELAEALIDRWKLAELLDRPVEHLSLGQKKRLALAAALARRPAVILLDEPLAGLDWPGTETMLADLGRLKGEGAAVALVTHEPALLTDLADGWLLLKEGGEHLLGTAPDIYSHFQSFSIRPLPRPLPRG